MEKAIVRLEYNLLVECPHCEEEVDLVDEEEDGEYSNPIFNNKWDKLKGECVFCPHCGKVFTIECVEY